MKSSENLWSYDDFREIDVKPVTTAAKLSINDVLREALTTHVQRLN